MRKTGDGPQPSEIRKPSFMNGFARSVASQGISTAHTLGLQAFVTLAHDTSAWEDRSAWN